MKLYLDKCNFFHFYLLKNIHFIHTHIPQSKEASKNAYGILGKCDRNQIQFGGNIVIYCCVELWYARMDLLSVLIEFQIMSPKCLCSLSLSLFLTLALLSLSPTFVCLCFYLHISQFSYHSIIDEQCGKEPRGRKYDQQWLEAHTLAIMNQKDKNFSQHLHQRRRGFILIGLTWIKCPSMCSQVQTSHMTTSRPKGDQGIMIVPLAINKGRILQR